MDYATLERAVSRSGVARVRLAQMKKSQTQKSSGLGGSMSLPEISRSPIRTSQNRSTKQASQRTSRYDSARPCRLPEVSPEQQLLRPKTVRIDSDLHKMRLQTTERILRQRRRVQTSKRNRDKKNKMTAKTGIFKARKVEASRFPVNYNVGFVPACVGHGSKGAAKGEPELKWTTPIAQIDMAKYLPMFVDGVRETEEPYRFVAVQGTFELLNFMILHKSGAEVINCLDEMVHYLRLTLNTHNAAVVLNGLKVIQLLIQSSPIMGPALTQHYRKLLPTLNLFFTQRRNLGDGQDYAQRKGDDLGVKITETLQLMERCGGPEAFMWIKYYIPCWESCARV